MTKVQNKKAVRKIANSSFKANRSRNVIAAIAIALTALLFTSIFTMGFGAVENIEKSAMRLSGGDGHAAVKYLTDEQFEKISSHPLIEEISYSKILCESINNESLIRRHTEFWYFDDTAFRYTFSEPTSGRKPKAENALVTDTKTLELLGVPLEIGAEVQLDLTVHGQQIVRNFVLSGWYQSDPAMNVGLIITSGAYVDAHIDELYISYYDDYCLTGAINGYIKFASSINIEENLKTVIEDSGFSMEDGAENFVETGINWAYMSANMSFDPTLIIALSSALLLIMLTGYLIIYNIFQISVIKDIRFYGLLKTIGTTGRQIKVIVRRQALILSLAGIPLGLLGGFFSGNLLVPVVMEMTTYAGAPVSVSPNPLIFLSASLFALITVFISTGKPGQLAAKVSPVEAVRSSGGSGIRKKTKSSRRGASVGRMALSNIGRNKIRTVFVILSLCLSIVLMNTVFTFSRSVDVNKALEKFNDSDFLIGPAGLFNYSYDATEAGALSESFINAVNTQEGFEAGGRLYSWYGVYTSKTSTQTLNKYPDGTFFTALYGLEDFPLSRLELIDGEIDIEKLNSGGYVLEGVPTDDYGNIAADRINHSVGDTIDLTVNEKTVEVVILGHVIENPMSNTDGGWGGSIFFLPSEIFHELTGVTWAMSYMFDTAEDSELAVESFLSQYTEAAEPTMSYRSKFTALAALEGLRDIALLIGGALAAVIGLIGILNFINSVLTGIITRRKEFAMMQSVGMSRRQLVSMLCFEGTYYALFTAASAAVLGILLSVIIVRPLCGQIWFLSYQPVLWPLLAAIPALLICGAVIPLISYHSTDKQSLVERLREAE